MVRRRKSQQDESLDLLLDTITNTFGGLIFVAILIALLVGERQPNSDRTRLEGNAEKLKALKSEISQVTAEIELVTKKTESEKDFLESFTSVEQRALASKHLTLKAKLRSARQKNKNLNQQQTQSKSMSEKLMVKLQGLNKALSKAESESGDIQKQLDQEKSKRTTDIDSPKQQYTNKDPVSVIVRWGRVYFMSDKTGLNIANNPDFEECKLLSCEINLGTTFFRTNKTGGIPLTDTARLAKKFEQFNQEQHFILLCIFEESFKEFKNLKESLVAKQLRYSPHLFVDGDKLTYGKAPRSKVQ